MPRPAVGLALLNPLFLSRHDVKKNRPDLHRRNAVKIGLYETARWRCPERVVILTITDLNALTDGSGLEKRHSPARAFYRRLVALPGRPGAEQKVNSDGLTGAWAVESRTTNSGSIAIADR